MTNLRQSNKTLLGIWIDHKEAIVVSLVNGESHVKHLDSNADSNVRGKGGYKSGGTAVAQSVSNEQRIEERRRHQLNDYYQMIIKSAAEADRIYIFGPGSAKNELQKVFIETNNLHKRIEAVETSDSMTENQVVAKVRSFFGVSEERF
jgi:hypothetical protein